MPAVTSESSQKEAAAYYICLFAEGKMSSSSLSCSNTRADQIHDLTVFLRTLPTHEERRNTAKRSNSFSLEYFPDGLEGEVAEKFACVALNKPPPLRHPIFCPSLAAPPLAEPIKSSVTRARRVTDLKELREEHSRTIEEARLLNVKLDLPSEVRVQRLPYFRSPLGQQKTWPKRPGYKVVCSR